MRSPKNIAAVADEILAEVADGEHVKLAEAAEARATLPTHETEVGELLHKIATDLRAVPLQVTYNDLNVFLGNEQ